MQSDQQRELEKYKADLQALVQIELARMKEEGAMQAQMRSEANQQAEKQQTDESHAYVGELRTLVADLIQGVQQDAQSVNAPREVVRDETGRAVGVSVGGVVRPIRRGPDGRIQGLE